MDDVKESAAKVQTPINVQDIKIVESVKSKGKNSRNSFVAVRVPGSASKLAILEHDTDSTIPSNQSNPALQDDWSAGGSSIIGMVFLIGIVVTCMNMGNFRKNKKPSAASNPFGDLGGGRKSRGFGGRRK